MNNNWAKFKKFLKKSGWFILSSFFALMTVQSSGFASFNKIEFNIIITPDNFPIVWPVDDGTGNPVDYGQGQSLSAGELLNASICLSSANCTVEALDAGAVYYKVVNIAGVGDVIFYYDEMGKLLGTRKAATIVADQETSNAYNSTPNTSEAIQIAAIENEFSTAPCAIPGGCYKSKF